MRSLIIPTAAALLLAASARVPYQWTHALSEGCSWHRRPAVAILGRGSPDSAAHAAEWRCLVRRGARDPDALPTIQVLLRKFPSPAELAAMNGEVR